MMFYTGKLRDFTKKAAAKSPFAVAFFMPVRIDKYSALYYNSIIVL